MLACGNIELAEVVKMTSAIIFSKAEKICTQVEEPKPGQQEAEGGEKQASRIVLRRALPDVVIHLPAD